MRPPVLSGPTGTLDTMGQLLRERPERMAGSAPDPAITLPVASVILDVALDHLDRPFDYTVPAALSAQANPGVRVRVRFAGTTVAGYVLRRSESSDHAGRLSPLLAVVSTEPVLTEGLVRTARHIADRYGGTMADVLRLAVPPRHARVEAEAVPPARATPVRAPRPPAPADPPEPPSPPESPEPPGSPEPPEPPEPSESPGPVGLARTVGPWQGYAGGFALIRRLRAGEQPRAGVAALPGEGRALIADAVAATVASGRGALLVVPDARDVAVFTEAVREVLPDGAVTCLTADLGPARRYRAWLSIRRGQARVVVGTRAAAFAPVADLGLLACWDDGDDLLAEPRAPYPHARDVLVRRAVDERSGLLLAGHAVTPEVAALARDGFLAVLAPTRERTRAVVPRIVVAGDDRELGRDPAARSARLPAVVLRTVRAALTEGPVLVQVPRAGYVPILACARCRHPAACAHCSGPLAIPSAGAVPGCRWCGRPAADWQCPECGAHGLRSRRIGAARTAEELGRAFPGVPVIQSAATPLTAPAVTAPAASAPAGPGAGHPRPGGSRSRSSGVRDTVANRPALVVATPGAEPLAAGGYAATVLLDGDVLLARPDLRAGQEALRRWLNAAALVRSGTDPRGSGTVVVVADPGQRAVQALVRWDPAGAADAELDDRVATALPPAAVIAELTGSADDVGDLLGRADLPPTAQVLGPVPVARVGEAAGQSAGTAPAVRALVRDRRGRGAELVGSLRRAQAARTARKLPHVRLRVDPVDLG